ncbi:class I SAM-dependent methyltransferase [Streptomyces sp. NPDC088768]|uniref:class I SAM-dependent methyltransferase n=1 Tax=Streptomyces sp. NPDC088768 TaxID=3365894 RepID=UPI00380788E5
MEYFEQHNARTWQDYGAHQIARTAEIPELDQWDWGLIGATGPGEEVLGELRGQRVLDLGSGLGRHAAYLAQRGAHVTALDSSPTQHERATSRYQPTERLRFVCADAADHLRRAAPYDLVYSIGAVPYAAPERLLPALASGLRPGGRLLFTALHTNSQGAGPSEDVLSRPEILRLPGTNEQHYVHMWVLAPGVWSTLLTAYGFEARAVTLLSPPDQDNPVRYLLIDARRVPTRPPTHSCARPDGA